MKLLLDEMYPPSIAEQLRHKHRDAHAVAARPDLRALSDTDLFACAQEEHRAVVTENLADFCRIADQCDQRGSPHYGLVLVSPARYPRGAKRTIGMLLTGLNRLMSEHHGDASSLRHWL